jgi:hypothetical protein
MMRTKAWTTACALSGLLVAACNGVAVRAVAAGATGVGGANGPTSANSASSTSTSASSATASGAGGSMPCGSGVPPQPILDLTPPDPSGQLWPIAVDLADVYYFVDLGKQLRRVPKDGGAATVLLQDEHSIWPGGGLVVDAANVYWVETSTPCQMLSCTDKTGVHVLSKQGGAPTSFVQTLNVYGLAIDSTYLYWTSPDAVTKVALAGGAPTQIASLVRPGVAITIDATNAYWVTYPTYPGMTQGQTLVESAPLGGGVVTTLGSIGSSTNPHTLAVGGNQVYFTGDDLAMVQVGGGSITHLEPDRTLAVATDATHVYWTQVVSSTESAVCKMPLGGGLVVTLALHQAIPDNGAIALDDSAVYWSDGTTIRKTMK